MLFKGRLSQIGVGIQFFKGEYWYSALRVWTRVCTAWIIASAEEIVRNWFILVKIFISHWLFQHLSLQKLFCGIYIALFLVPYTIQWLHVRPTMICFMGYHESWLWLLMVPMSSCWNWILQKCLCRCISCFFSLCYHNVQSDSFLLLSFFQYFR